MNLAQARCYDKLHKSLVTSDELFPFPRDASKCVTILFNVDVNRLEIEANAQGLNSY